MFDTHRTGHFPTRHPLHLKIRQDISQNTSIKNSSFKETPFFNCLVLIVMICVTLLHLIGYNAITSSEMEKLFQNDCSRGDTEYLAAPASVSHRYTVDTS